MSAGNSQLTLASYKTQKILTAGRNNKYDCKTQ